MAVYTTLIEAKAHLRVTDTSDDTYIAGLQDMVEEFVLNEIQGSVVGIGTVSTVATKALMGVDTVFSDYVVGNNILVAGETLRIIETITDDTHLTVTTAFSNTASDKTFTMYSGMPLVSGVLPLQLKQAMLLMIGHFYMLREPVTVGVQVNKIPFGFDALIAPYKYYTIV